MRRGKKERGRVREVDRENWSEERGKEGEREGKKEEWRKKEGKRGENGARREGRRKWKSR